MILILGLVIFVVHIPEVNAKDINFGWSSVEGWSSQPYEGCGGKRLLRERKSKSPDDHVSRN